MTSTNAAEIFLEPDLSWSEWMSQPMPGEFGLLFPRVIGEGQLGDPTPPGWPL